MTARLSDVRDRNEMLKAEVCPEEKIKGCWSLTGARHHSMRAGRISCAQKKTFVAKITHKNSHCRTDTKEDVR